MERISVTVRLNGISLQLDEPAFQRLEAYVDEARRALEGNPDRDEILGDLERSVVEKCARRLQPPQAIVTLTELEPALQEIGTVHDAEPAAAATGAGPREPARRRLEQVSEGALISGVCQGLARYLGVDVVLVRVIALLLLFGTGGGMIVVYLLLMLVLPYAPEAPGARIRRIPAKCREFVEFLRGKLSAATS
jgi:phage shock protein PspC (stress-responsive transcriptional regulator)